MTPNKIEIMPLGISISFKLRAKDYNKKILKANLIELKKVIVAIAGPVTNVLLVLYFYFFETNIISNDIAIYANILICIFNLLPVYPLDGGRILKGLIHITCGGKTSKIITNKVANIITIVITMISSIGIFYLENIAILIIVAFLWLLVIRENKRFKYIIKAYE